MFTFKPKIVVDRGVPAAVPTRPRRAAAALAGLIAFAAAHSVAAATFPYRVLQRIEVNGTEPVRALTFSPDGKQVYVGVGHEIRNFDVASSRPGDVIKVPGAVVALAMADAGGNLYAALGEPARLLVLRTDPLRVVSSVALRDGAPVALLYDPDAHALYAESDVGQSVTKFDADGKSLGTVRLPGRPEQMAGDGRGTLYVADSRTDSLDVVDTATMRSTGAIPTPGCQAPSGLAMDTVGRRLFVACGNGVSLVVDTDIGFSFVQLPIQRAAALRTVFAFHPLGAEGWKGGAFMAGDGAALDAIQMKAFISYVDGGSLPLSGRCTALALSPAARQLWLGIATTPGRNQGESAADATSTAAGFQIWVLGAETGGSP